MKRKTALLIIIVSLSLSSFAQDKSFKFGSISASDFDLRAFKFDTSAAAVYIADVGSIEFFGNKKSWFSTKFKKKVRIKILKPAGFQYGEIVVQLYHNKTDEETLEGVQASSYNLENGKVQETKLDTKSVFNEAYNEKITLKKFAIPAIKEGTIIEYQYTINSDFIHSLHEWEFQGIEPRLYSQYTVAIPAIFDYVPFKRGALEFTSHTSKDYSKNYTVRMDRSKSEVGYIPIGDPTETLNVSTVVVEHTWVVKNAPALKEAAFTSSINNYLTKLSFQLSQIRLPEEPVKDVMTTWVGLKEELMKSDGFGVTLKEGTDWLSSEMPNIVSNSDDALTKAKKIHAFVRDNFTCTRRSGIFTENSLKSVWKNKKGTAAEINFVLIALLRNNLIAADPLLISTRENGFCIAAYPEIEQFNYVVARIDLAGEKINLDASVPSMGFGRLPINCYNGHSRVLNDKVEPVYLNADDLKDIKTTSAFMSVSDDGVLSAKIISAIGNLESEEIRTQVGSIGVNQYFKQLVLGFTDEIRLKNEGIDSLNKFDSPLNVHYELSMGRPAGDMLYFNPMLTARYSHNYFDAEDRRYPVEMMYTRSDTYTLTFMIPKGYDVEELPKSERIMLNETEGIFEYIVVKKDDVIQLRSKVSFNKAVYAGQDYNKLREFYNHVLRKHNEQIILKKVKA